MNAIFRTIERVFWGPPDHALDTPLLKFSGSRKFTVRDAFNGMLFIGSPGSGKTTAAGTYYRALLHAQFGGLVLCVKETQITAVVDLCRECNRENDIVLIEAGGSHRFNPLEGASIPDATSLLAELAEILRDRKSGYGENEDFFRQQAEILIRHLLHLCLEHYDQLDITEIAEMFRSRPTNANQLAAPAWRQKSVMAAVLERAENSANAELRAAAKYFTVDFVSHGDRLQGSIAATVNGLFETLSNQRMRALFGGVSTFNMRDIFQVGKICIVGLPTLGSSRLGVSESEGKITNGLMQFCFIRAAVKEQRETNVFLLSDECQETVSRELRRQLSVLREYRVATVLLTQSVHTLDAKLGETERKAIFGNCATKVFLRQVDATSRDWAAHEIGKHMVKEKSNARTAQGFNKSSRTTSWQMAERWRVRPEEFAALKTGQSVMLRDGDFWRQKWHKDHPGRWFTTRLA